MNSDQHQSLTRWEKNTTTSGMSIVRCITPLQLAPLNNRNAEMSKTRRERKEPKGKRDKFRLPHALKTERYHLSYPAATNTPPCPIFVGLAFSSYLLDPKSHFPEKAGMWKLLLVVLRVIHVLLQNHMSSGDILMRWFLQNAQ